MFDNIKSLKLSTDQMDHAIATAMVSSEGEVMNFTAPVLIEGKISIKTCIKLLFIVI